MGLNTLEYENAQCLTKYVISVIYSVTIMFVNNSIFRNLYYKLWILMFLALRSHHRCYQSSASSIH